MAGERWIPDSGAETQHAKNWQWWSWSMLNHGSYYVPQAETTQ